METSTALMPRKFKVVVPDLGIEAEVTAVDRYGATRKVFEDYNLGSDGINYTDFHRNSKVCGEKLSSCLFCGTSTFREGRGRGLKYCQACSLKLGGGKHRRIVTSTVTDLASRYLNSQYGYLVTGEHTVPGTGLRVDLYFRDRELIVIGEVKVSSGDAGVLPVQLLSYYLGTRSVYSEKILLVGILDSRAYNRLVFENRPVLELLGMLQLENAEVVVLIVDVEENRVRELRRGLGGVWIDVGSSTDLGKDVEPRLLLLSTAFEGLLSGNFNEGLDRELLLELVNKTLSRLKPRESLVLRLKFGMDGHGGSRTLEEIGKIVGVTRERVRQVERVGLRKFRLPRFSKELRDLLKVNLS